MNAIEALRRRTYPLLHPIRTRPKNVARRLESMRTVLLAAGRPDTAHYWLDADPDTKYPLPGVAHPRPEGRAL